MRTTVFILDHDNALRDALTALLEPHHHRVIGFADADAFLEVPEPTTPSCVLVDIPRPATEVPSVQQVLRRRGSRLPVVCMSTMHHAQQVITAFREGAVDFLLKPFEHEAVVAVAHRATLEHAHRLIKADERREARQAFDQLTPREREVMRLAAKGFQNKEIAELLGNAPATVKRQRAVVHRKLGTRAVTDWVRFVPYLDA